VDGRVPLPLALCFPKLPKLSILLRVPGEYLTSFIPFYPSEFTSSAEVLESKRKSISGLPPSVPDVHSQERHPQIAQPCFHTGVLVLPRLSLAKEKGDPCRPKPPSPPPKDNGNGLAPSQGHGRQPSVSTLGPDVFTTGTGM
jgi:hypothetical protein